MKRVLVTPLDWGLGHATRCIPIIRALLERSCIVYIGASGDSMALLKKEFPTLTFFPLPAYDPRYPSSQNMVLKMALQIPKFISVIKKEHDVVEALIKQFQINLVISDNRYGCWSSKIPTVILTHQLNILMSKGWGWLAAWVRVANKKRLEKFTHCWIPDHPGDLSLTGELTDHDPQAWKHVVHIGPLSRFGGIAAQEKRYDVLCILSGPEPQRSLFETILKDQLKVSGLKYLITRGMPSLSEATRENETEFLTSAELQQVIQQSSIIIARSGYSTVMDLFALGKKAIFVPTPGQTEQEYLAKKFKDNNVMYAMEQNAFDLKLALAQSSGYSGFDPKVGLTQALLNRALDQALNEH